MRREINHTAIRVTILDRSLCFLPNFSDEFVLIADALALYLSDRVDPDNYFSVSHLDGDEIPQDVRSLTLSDIHYNDTNDPIISAINYCANELLINEIQTNLNKQSLMELFRVMQSLGGY